MHRREFLGIALLTASSSLLPFGPVLGASPALAGLPKAVRTINVSNSEGVRRALQSSRPGDQIVLADGTYTGSTVMMAKPGVAGAPIVLRARNPLKAKLRCPLVLGGTFNIVSGLNIEGYLVTLSGTSNRITRCKISDNPGVGIFCVSGSDGLIDHCDITTRPFPAGVEAPNARRNAICVSSRPGEKFLRCRIAHNWIHDIGPKPTANYHSGGTHAIALGETATWGDVELNTVVETNLIENCMGGNGILEPKTPGNIIRRNTMLNCPKGCMINRQGWDNLWEENYIENCGGMYLWSRVIARRNKIVGGGRLCVGAGNIEWNDASRKPEPGFQPYQRSSGVVLDSNEAQILIGLRYTNCSLPALNTRILNHRGSIRYAFHSRTSSSKQTQSSGSAASKLSRSDVGPYAI
jgi:poly(beta-D-mannuronate) lyase